MFSKNRNSRTIYKRAKISFVFSQNRNSSTYYQKCFLFSKQKFWDTL